MVVQRVPTSYRKIRNDANLDEDADDIELLQYQRNPNEGQHLDNVVENIRLKTLLERQHSSFSNGSACTSCDRNGCVASKLPHNFRRPIRHRFLSGWRAGVLAALIGAIVVFIFNVVITICVLSGTWSSPEGAFGRLYQGDCEKTRRLNVWIHLLVNTLSTLLLGASNYCMQVLSAPTRDELVRAHAQQVWLHIGVPSLRNLRHIARERTVLWVVLFISSVPLHLLFNSVAFPSLQANEYMVIPTTEDWLHGASYDTSGFIDMDVNDTKNAVFTIDSYRLNATRINNSFTIYGTNSTEYQNLSAKECFDTYKNQYMSGHGNLYIIQDGPAIWRNLSSWWPEFHSNNTFVWTRNSTSRPITNDEQLLTSGASFPFLSKPDFYQSNGWRCPSHTPKTCDTENPYEISRNRSEWRPYETSIKYCLVEVVPERCSLLFSTPIAILVIFSNVAKAICIGLTLHKYRRHSPLVTLGDAIAHFLDNPDPQTKNRCLFSRRIVEAQWTWERFHGAKKDELGVAPEQYNPKRQLWQTAPSGHRWAATYISFTIAILLGIVCTTRSLVGMPADLRKLWHIGFGTITGNNLMQIDINLTGSILLTNIPQVLLSYLYLAFNALYTNMFVAKEWSTYIHERKPLRVTLPVGRQRGTYWLNVPFRYAIPMQILSGLFHWLTSQSIFPVSIFILEPHSRDISRQISTCGFSPIAIILATSLGIAIAIGGLGIGRFRFVGAMPVAASCSAAISAACHPSPEDLHASVLPVQWGAITHGKQGDDGEEPVGHCAFSSLPVEEPIPGRLYA